ncbi:MAG: site-specific DNA-methyltransferase [Planctomycetota bacterium]|nr:site-specific DNA-methyltransferase [Planctomycetota bacterium]
MPTLNWIGKDAVVDHHRQVPYHLLRCDEKLSVGDPGSGNLLVQGDNLLALKALLPYYAGQVKCIYIDPPYNTGNENWVYNDNVNSPEIKAWLGKVVGGEAEDLSRHDKWLCMMYPRLSLLREMLSEDGVFLCSIDENELYPLKLILDELFGRQRCVGTICWKMRNTDNRVKSRLSTDHEYVLVYSKGGPLVGRVIDRSDFKNPDNDPRGPYVTDPLTGKAATDDRPNLHYRIENPATGDSWEPDPARGWITDQAGFNSLLSEKRVWWPPNPKRGKPRKKRYLSETSERMPVSSFWTEIRGQTGADEVDQILGERLFAFPKSLDLITRLLDIACPKDALILDSFAGSGTTAHAAMALNLADGGTRRVVSVEMDPQIAENVTAKRLRRALEGYQDLEGTEVPPIGGGFRFCRLSHPIFDENGQIHPEVRFADLAAHVFFTETGEPIPKRPTGKTPLIGVCNGTAYYLLFNGVLGDKRPDGGNVLTARVLEGLPAHDGPKIVYGEGTRLGSGRLSRQDIVFRQVPYEIETQ